MRKLDFYPQLMPEAREHKVKMIRTSYASSFKVASPPKASLQLANKQTATRQKAMKSILTIKKSSLNEPPLARRILSSCNV